MGYFVLHPISRFQWQRLHRGTLLSNLPPDLLPSSQQSSSCFLVPFPVSCIPCLKYSNELLPGIWKPETGDSLVSLRHMLKSVPSSLCLHFCTLITLRVGSQLGCGDYRSKDLNLDVVCPVSVQVQF